ncbi:DUF5673 domain-containing protein [Peptoniphilaceae bacterium SGI.131]
MFLTNVTNTNTQSTNIFSNDMFIYVMYGFMILFFVYRIIKHRLALNKLSGERKAFERSFSKMMYGLGFVILGFGALQIYYGFYGVGAVMIGLILVIFIESKNKLVFAENGYVSQGDFVEWDKIKKWGFDKTRNELVISYKALNREKTSYNKVKPEEIDKINGVIRKHRLKK